VAWFEWTAAVITAIAVYLQTRENIWNWPAAIVSVTMYMVVYAKSGFYSEVGLQAFFLATSIYGWHQWLRGGPNRSTLAINRATPRMWLACMAFGVVFWFLDASITSRIKGVSFPYIDAATVTVSLIAQWMIARKVLENWLLWIAVNIVYVPMFLVKALYPTALLYAFMLGLAIKGYIDWRRVYRAGLGASLPTPAAA
jgi:nicotinamide mononucleotide transporter